MNDRINDFALNKDLSGMVKHCIKDVNERAKHRRTSHGKNSTNLQDMNTTLIIKNEKNIQINENKEKNNFYIYNLNLNIAKEIIIKEKNMAEEPTN